jgi:hypothetical protein
MQDRYIVMFVSRQMSRLGDIDLVSGLVSACDDGRLRARANNGRLVNRRSVPYDIIIGILDPMVQDA